VSGWRVARFDDSRVDARVSGYRDVAVNLRLCGEEAERLRVSTHVAELQLILLPFAQVKVSTFAPGLSHCCSWG
jgi:hypothetical protein